MIAYGLYDVLFIVYDYGYFVVVSVVFVVFDVFVVIGVLIVGAVGIYLVCCRGGDMLNLACDLVLCIWVGVS